MTTVVVVVAAVAVVAGVAFQRRTTVRTTAGGGSGPGHICRRVYLEYKFSFRKRLKSALSMGNGMIGMLLANNHYITLGFKFWLQGKIPYLTILTYLVG